MNIQINKNLPTAELDHLNLGYMRLTDSAPLIVAQHLGLYENFGLNVTLHREVSWANIRDKTIAGTFDACQMRPLKTVRSTYWSPQQSLKWALMCPMRA